ncbi:MAG: restriction endonuclease subunit S [Fibrobacterota bacterium]|nr:MAG: restriction endonuclease subunit S [Fibrobacterota bacterium]
MSEDLPESWVETTLGTVVEYGKTHKAEPEQISDDTWVLELEDIERDTSNILQRKTFRDRNSRSTKNSFKKNDVLYGKLRPYLNKVVIADIDGVCSTEIVPLSGGTNLNNRFLWYWLKSPIFLDYVSRVGRGVNMPRLSTEDGQNAPLVLSPATEQRRIVAKLDALQSRTRIAREALDAVAPLLKSFRQSVLQAAVTGALTEEWRSKQRKLPEWEVINLGEVVEDIRYGTSAKCHYQPVATPVLRIPNVGEGAVKLGDIKYGTFDASEVEKLALAVGDILVIRSNGSADLVGKPALISDREAGYLFAGYLIRLRFLKEKITPEFALLALRSPQTRDWIESETKSSSGVNNISAEKLRNIPLSLPPLAEQIEIVRRVQHLFAMADAMEVEFAAAQRSVDQLDQSLLATAFRGELVPQDPSDEPASVLLERIRAARAAVPDSKDKRGRKASSGFDSSVLMAAESVAPKKRGRPGKVSS